MVTLTQIELRIANLQKKADDLRKKKSASVIASIKKMMAENGVTLQDLEADVEAPRKKGRPAGSQNNAQAVAVEEKAVKVAAKYRDPVTGATWSGRARPPAWIKDAKDRSKFLIDPPTSGATSATTASKRNAKK